MIQCIKTLRYELRPEGIDTFEYLTQLGLQTIDPPSLAPSELVIQAELVFHSPLKRVQQCLKRLPNVQYVQDAELREVPFDLRKLCGRGMWQAEGSVAVRREMTRSFIRDNLPVPRDVLLDEIVALLRRCLLEDEATEIAIVSHSFRLKMLEAFVRSSGLLRQQPEILGEFIDGARKTYEFGGGFTITRDDLQRALAAS